MYICICKQVTEKQIKSAIKEGATSLSDLRNELGIASQCGQCSGCARKLLEKQDTARRNSAGSLDVFPLFSRASLINS